MSFLDPTPGRIRLSVQPAYANEIALSVYSRPVDGRYENYTPVELARFQCARTCDLYDALPLDPIVATYDAGSTGWISGSISWESAEVLLRRFMREADILERSPDEHSHTQ